MWVLIRSAYVFVEKWGKYQYFWVERCTLFGAMQSLLATWKKLWLLGYPKSTHQNLRCAEMHADLRHILLAAHVQRYTPFTLWHIFFVFPKNVWHVKGVETSRLPSSQHTRLWVMTSQGSNSTRGASAHYCTVLHCIEHFIIIPSSSQGKILCCFCCVVNNKNSYQPSHCCRDTTCISAEWLSLLKSVFCGKKILSGHE